MVPGMMVAGARCRRLLGPLLLNCVLAGLAWYFLGSLTAWDAPRRQAGTYGAGLAFLQFIALAALIDRAVRLAVSRPDSPKNEQHWPRLALHFLSFLIYAVLASTGLRLVFNQSLETVLAASGIAGLVLGFALRGLVSDIFSGIALHLDSNLRRGDWLQFQHRGQEMTARLLEFDWRSAILYDREDNAVLIPNSEFAQLRVNNMSHPTPFTESCAKLDIGAEHDHMRVAAILQNAANRAAAEGHIMSDPAPHVRIADIDHGVVPFNIWYSIGPQVSRGQARHIVLMHALGFLKAAGIPVNIEVQCSDNLALAEVRRRILTQVAFFSALSQDEFLVMAQETLPLRFPAQHIVIRAGDPGNSMFVVLEGQLDVVVQVDEAPLVVASLWPGDCFGEMSLFTGAVRSATISVRHAAILMEVTKDTMSDLFRKKPSLMDSVAAMIESRNQANREKVDQLNAPRASGEMLPVSLLSRIRSFFGTAIKAA